jgi:release factor glutamine methyltransferase
VTVASGPTVSPGSAGEAVVWGTSQLRSTGSDTARLDAELLLAHVLGRDRAWLLAHPEASVDDTSAYEALISRRASGEPVAYLRGFKEWHGLRLRTDARALIPRPETELLADATIDEIAGRLGRDDAPVVAWEVATGSGAVAVAIALRFRHAIALGRLRLIASDTSPDALELAAENLAAHGVERLVDLACADLLEPAGTSLPRPDVVAANLPYVSSAEVESRVGSLGFEPRIALDGGPDGLALLRPFLASIPRAAAPGATAFLELGVDQADIIAGMAGDASVTVVPDLAGIDRVVRVQLPEPPS